MSNTIQTKRCPKCKQHKLRSKFHRDKTTKDGSYPYCKQCRKKYYATNKTKILQKSKQYRLTHRQQIVEKDKQYYATVRGYLNKIWNAMLYRCNNPKNKAYKYYGGREVKVKFTSFDDFFDYVVDELKINPRGLTVDRINNDGHYESGNIRFISQADNNRNRRNPEKL